MRAAFAILLSVIVSVSCQEGHYQSPHQAAILSDTRYLAGDGTFGAAYSQEDGVVFKEESDVNGDRRGSYSYVDPTGKRRTVTYTAGKNGFQIKSMYPAPDPAQATGDHIPSAPPQVPPQPEYVPLAQYNPPDYQHPSYAPAPQQYPRHYQPDYEPQPVVYQPQLQLQYQYRAQPQPPPQPSPQPQPQPQPQLRYHHPPELQAIPSYAAPSAHYQPQPRPATQYNAITAPAAHRNFYPPGKLDFNRTPDGFSYMFTKS